MGPYTNEQLHKIDQDQYLPTFNRYPITLERGLGSKVWDVEGNEYIDTVAGIAVNSVGHSHPKVVEAISRQAGQLMHISNAYLSVPQAELSKKLIELSGLDRVFFANSGAEAVEGAIKIARKYARSIGRGGSVISFEGSFHGRTLATIATGKAKYQKGFGPMPGGFIKVPFNDMEAVFKVCNKETAAIIVEPIQGEGGVKPANPCFLLALREFCTQRDIVLIFDEVQTGIGRTGKMFAKDHFGIQPDIMPLAKALGGGIPIGAILSNEKVSSAMEKGDHGTTFGGNPLVCAASLAVLEVIEEEGLVQASHDQGVLIRQMVEELDNDLIREVRGKGLMVGLQFDFPTRPLATRMLQKGILANANAMTVLRMVPPLNIQEDELKRVIAVLAECLEEIKEAGMVLEKSAN